MNERQEAAQSAYRIGGIKALEDMGFKTPEGPSVGRWLDEALTAAWSNGWEVLEYLGNNDYQGWGCLLLKRDDEWATLYWSYGPCGGCDSYEGMSTPDIVASLAGDIDVAKDEATARKLFDDHKGRGW